MEKRIHTEGGEDKPLSVLASHSGEKGVSLTEDTTCAAETMGRDLTRLAHWARLRNRKRIVNDGALDEMLRHKTELSLTVKKDYRNPQKYQVYGYMGWSNASSVSLVSEYMVLMCQVIGNMTMQNGVGVWYKTQVPNPPLQPQDLELKSDENL